MKGSRYDVIGLGEMVKHRESVESITALRRRVKKEEPLRWKERESSPLHRIGPRGVLWRPPLELELCTSRRKSGNNLQFFVKINLDHGHNDQD